MEAATMDHDPWDYEDPYDELDEDVAAAERASPGARGRIVAEIERLRLAHELAAHRRELGLSLSAAAARLGRSVEDVAALEEGDAGAAIEELAAYAAGLGLRVEWRLVAAQAS
jgi:ribosome-binding protein aMBF1 (putative translation factor)